MRLDNLSGIPDDVVREVLRFVCPPRVTRYDVEAYSTHRSTYYGDADPAFHKWTVRLRVGDSSMFPRGPRESRGGAHLPDPWVADRTEALVFVAAHELRHLWQAIVPRGRRVWGARGQYSERDCDAYALKMLRAWRRRNDSKPETAVDVLDRYLAEVSA